MGWDSGLSAIRMGKAKMASFLPDKFKSKIFQSLANPSTLQR